MPGLGLEPAFEVCDAWPFLQLQLQRPPPLSAHAKPPPPPYQTIPLGEGGGAGNARRLTIYIYIYIYIHTHICIYYICICVSVYPQTYRHADIPTDRQTDRQTDRRAYLLHACKHTHIHTWDVHEYTDVRYTTTRRVLKQRAKLYFVSLAQMPSHRCATSASVRPQLWRGVSACQDSRTL